MEHNWQTLSPQVKRREEKIKQVKSSQDKITQHNTTHEKTGKTIQYQFDITETKYDSYVEQREAIFV
jgi:hypothetical protein